MQLDSINKEDLCNFCRLRAIALTEWIRVTRSKQANWFWRNTGETPGSFLKLATDLMPMLLHLTLDGLPRRRQRRQKINIINQILLVMMWFRKYLHVDTLALCFDIDPTSVIRIIYRTLPELWRYFQNQIRWPNVLEWAIKWETGLNFLCRWCNW